MTLYPGPRDPTFFDQRDHFSIADYLNQATGHEASQQRRMIEHWYRRYPECNDKEDLRARLTDRRNKTLLPGVLELVTAEILRRSGFTVEVHPSLPDTRSQPDFRARKGGSSLLVECAMASDAAESASEEVLKGDLLSQIHQLDLAKYRLQVQFFSVGRKLPRRRQLQDWLSEQLKRNEFDKPPDPGLAYSLGTWEWEDWRVRFAAVSTEWDDVDSGGPIWMVGPDVGSAGPTVSGRLRATVKDKQQRYGTPNEPLLLVLSTHGLYPFDRELFDSLLGESHASVNLATREWTKARAPDGAWVDTRGIRGKRLSGLLFVPALGPRSLTSAEWTLVHHPEPNYPLPPQLFPFTKEFTWHGSDADESLPAVSFAEFIGEGT